MRKGTWWSRGIGMHLMNVGLSWLRYTLNEGQKWFLLIPCEARRDMVRRSLPKRIRSYVVTLNFSCLSQIHLFEVGWKPMLLNAHFYSVTWFFAVWKNLNPLPLPGVAGLNEESWVRNLGWNLSSWAMNFLGSVEGVNCISYWINIENTLLMFERGCTSMIWDHTWEYCSLRPLRKWMTWLLFLYVLIMARRVEEHGKTHVYEEIVQKLSCSWHIFLRVVKNWILVWSSWQHAQICSCNYEIMKISPWWYLSRSSSQISCAVSIQRMLSSISWLIKLVTHTITMVLQWSHAMDFHSLLKDN